jgi:type IV pilus assembly protein PilB
LAEGKKQVKQSSPEESQVTLVEDGGDFTELWRPTEGNPKYRGPERILLERGYITVDQLEAAAIRQQEDPRLGVLDALVHNQAIDETLALQTVADYFKLPFLRVSFPDVDSGVLGLLPLEYIRNKKVLPICQKEDAVIVGICDPADIFLIDDIKRRIDKPLKLVVVSGDDIQQVVEEVAASPEEQVDEIIKDISEDAVEVVDEKSEEVADLEKSAGESPVIRYVNFLISTSVKEDASDIHIEPGERNMRVRFRIDGVLFAQQSPPAHMHAAIVSRLKIMSNLDIAERRLPQDGRIRATVHGRTVDLRVSTLPTAHGEKCVIRILDNRSIMVGLENLGMAEETLASFRNQILQPHGIVLVTGPTGSGKTTTLYSAMQVMDGDKLNISTVEDPVEYELDFTNQVNVHESIGMTFSAALRSLLRQDPDVIMLGEIRDEETARIAIQASLTGHMVLSTLHTNDAPSSITRIINIGVEPYLISAAVNAVIAQRLVRRICESCKQPLKTIPDRIKAYLEKYNYKLDKVYQGTGCEKCRQTGFKGRVGIYELLELNEELRDLVTSNPSLGDLRRAAMKSGMASLRDDGLRKVSTGATTVDEIMRVTET